MKKVQLTQNKNCFVDDEDFEYINSFKWCYSNGYATRRISKTKTVSMQRFLLNVVDKNKVVDHI